jgi:hypothetical protein
VVTRFAKDHPETITHLAVSDSILTRVMFEQMNATIPRGHWFFIFSQVPDLPEALIAGRQEIRLRYILQGWIYDPEALTPEDLAADTRACRKPGAVRGALNDHHAGKEDVAQDQEDAGRQITSATLAYGPGFRVCRPDVGDERNLTADGGERPNHLHTALRPSAA